jgi:NADPH-dependent ferric siderophore reductase
MRRGQMTGAWRVHLRELVADESALPGVVDVLESSLNSRHIPW